MENIRHAIAVDKFSEFVSEFFAQRVNGDIDPL
jgi:queuine/archaeosine tRNA-ribosyltransferase